jgi:hypothetical protein
MGIPLRAIDLNTLDEKGDFIEIVLLFMAGRATRPPVGFAFLDEESDFIKAVLPYGQSYYAPPIE